MGEPEDRSDLEQGEDDEDRQGDQHQSHGVARDHQGERDASEDEREHDGDREHDRGGRVAVARYEAVVQEGRHDDDDERDDGQDQRQSRVPERLPVDTGGAVEAGGVTPVHASDEPEGREEVEQGHADEEGQDEPAVLDRHGRTEAPVHGGGRGGGDCVDVRHG